MATHRVQRWTQEEYSIRGDIVMFRAKIGRRMFSVHEDILCSHSEYFSNVFQMNRKPIERDCAICYQELNPKADDVTFCRNGCGNNFHKTCLDQWTNAKASPKCPMCRKDWEEGSAKVITLEKEVEDDTIQLYLDWLYTGILPERDDVSLNVGNDPASIQYHQLLVKAWELSSVFEAKDFADPVVGRLIESWESSHTR